MIYKPTQEIGAYMDVKDIHYNIRETDSSSYVSVIFNGKVAKNLNFRFISRDNDNDFSLRCYSIVNVPEEKIPLILKILNEGNNSYRFIKLVLDDDRDVNAEYDYPVSGENIGHAAYEIMIRFIDILDKVYPKIMGAIWG